MSELAELLACVDAALIRLNPGHDRQYLPPVSDADWAQLSSTLPQARGGELEVWFRWHNGQAEGAELLPRELGALTHVTSQGRLLSLGKALRVRSDLLAREDGWRFEDSVPLFALPATDDDGSARYVVYQVRGREAGNLIHTLTLSPNVDAWPLAVRREASGRAGLVQWATGLLDLVPAIFGPFTPAQAAQRWVLAASGIVRHLSKADLGCFGWWPRPFGSRDAAIILRRDWNIANADELVPSLTEHVSGPTERPALHWGAGAGAAELGYLAYYCSAEQAWAIALHAARRLRETFSSWEEFGRAYLVQRAEQLPDRDDEEKSEAAVAWLLSDPRSPWRVIPWQTELPADLPVPVPRPYVTHQVSTSEELYRALIAAEPADQIRLRAGHYRGSFSPASAGITLIGEPGVVLEAITDEPVLSTYHPIVAEHLELRASGTIVVNHGVFMRLAQCRLVGGDDGIQSYAPDDVVAQETARVATLLEETGVEHEPNLDHGLQLVGCVIEDTGDRGVVIEHGFAYLQDTCIQNTGGHALTLRTSAQWAYALRCQILQPGGVAARAFSNAELTLEDVEIRDAAGIGLVVSGGAHARLLQTRISGSKGQGVLVKGGAGIQMVRCHVEHSTGANIDLADVSRSLIAECTITGGAWGGVYLHPGADVIVARCTITGSALACVFADGPGGDPVPVVVASTLGDNAQGGAVFVANGARLRLADVRIQNTPGIAVEVNGSFLQAEAIVARGCAGGLVAHNGGELYLRRAEVCDGTDNAVTFLGATGLVDELLVNGGLRGLVVGQGSKVVASRCAFSGLTGAGAEAEDGERAFAIMVGEASELTVLGGSVVADGDDDAIHVLGGGTLVAEGLSVIGGGNCGIRVMEARLHLVGGHVGGANAAGVLIKSGSAASMVGTVLGGNAYAAVEVRDDASVLLLRDAVLNCDGGESAVFVHSGGQVLTQGSTLQGDAHRLVAVHAPGVLQQVELDVTGAPEVVMELLAAMAGPTLQQAKDRMAAWAAAQVGPGSERTRA